MRKRELVPGWELKFILLCLDGKLGVYQLKLATEAGRTEPYSWVGVSGPLWLNFDQSN